MVRLNCSTKGPDDLRILVENKRMGVGAQRGKAFPSESECAKRMAKRNNFVEDQQDWDESIKTFCLRVC